MSNPGDKDKRVQLQKRTMTADGDEVYYTDEIKPVWAKVKTIRSQKALLAGAFSIPDTLYLTIWYRPLEAEEYRVAYAGNIYIIEGAIDIDNAHVEIEITCTREPKALSAIARPE